MSAETGDVALLASPDVVSAALHPLRRRILDLLDQPGSATTLARQLAMSRQKVNYHVRALEDLGLVTLVEERPRRGVVERIIRRTHDHVLVDPHVVGLAGLDRASRTGLGAVMAAAVTILRQSARLANGAVARDERVATSLVDAEVRLPDPASLQAFTDDLAALIARHDHPTQGAMRFRFIATTLPHPPSERPDDT